MLDAILKTLASEKKVTFKIKVVAGAAKNEIVGTYGEDMLKIKIAAVRERGKANEKLIKFLAKTTGLPAQNIHIKTGTSSPLKTIEIIP
jgi:uncharacterized protein